MISRSQHTHAHSHTRALRYAACCCCLPERSGFVRARKAPGRGSRLGEGIAAYWRGGKVPIVGCFNRAPTRIRRPAVLQLYSPGANSHSKGRTMPAGVGLGTSCHLPGGGAMAERADLLAAALQPLTVEVSA